VHAERFAVGRGWLRRLLADILGTAPADVPLDYIPGKPRLEGHTGPCFNVSHAGDVVVVALSDREVGVDIERGGDCAVLDAAAVACTASERAALDVVSSADRADAFLRLWTAKEAYLKATGTGLAVPPDRVGLGPASGGASPVIVAGEPGPPRWWVREFCPAPGYIGAVAAEGADWTLVVRDARPVPETT
jgi:4'-phosphopantetheinyl transferase